MSYFSEVLADSPWLYWKLDDTAGVTAVDSSGNGRDGTYAGSPTLNQSPLITSGRSVFFDATDDLCQSSVVFNSSTATVECWFDYDGTPAVATDIWMVAGCSESPGTGIGDKLLGIDDAGHAVFYVFDGVPKTATGTAVLGAGQYHLVGTISGTTATIYVNGAFDGSTPASGSYTGFTNPNVMVAGASLAAGGANRELGRRDEFAIYTTELSAPRILAHYQAGLQTGQQVLSMQSHVFGHNMW